MNQKKVLLVTSVAICWLLLSSAAVAFPGVKPLYLETNLGNGLWHYDYTFYNTSTEGENLFSLFLYFTQPATVTGAPLPTGWDGIVWTGTNTTDWLDTYANPGYEIASNSSLGGFSFITHVTQGLKKLMLQLVLGVLPKSNFEE